MNFDQNRAAAVRAAIEQTTRDCRHTFPPAGLPESTLTLLETHLATLLQTERDLLSAGAPVSAEETPWYPDDSGEWVEIPDDCLVPPEHLKPDTVVAVLQRMERDDKEYDEMHKEVDDWMWDMAETDCGRIVAYKVVEQ